MLYEKVKFNQHLNEFGKLVAIENNKEIPFEIKRIYYVIPSKSNVVRGKHAHKKLQQVAICVSGSCDFMFDDGKNKETVRLSQPNEGVLIKDMIWHEFSNFSKDCLVLVLASDFYTEDDYIRNYSDFLNLISNK